MPRRVCACYCSCGCEDDPNPRAEHTKGCMLNRCGGLACPPRIAKKEETGCMPEWDEEEEDLTEEEQDENGPAWDEEEEEEKEEDLTDEQQCEVYYMPESKGTDGVPDESLTDEQQCEAYYMKDVYGISDADAEEEDASSTVPGVPLDEW